MHNKQATGIVFLTPTGKSFALALYPTYVKKADEMAAQIYKKLRGLSFWPILKKKIQFIVSDGCASQLKANKLIIEMMKKDGVKAHELVCQMHATAIMGTRIIK